MAFRFRAEYMAACSVGHVVVVSAEFSMIFADRWSRDEGANGVSSGERTRDRNYGGAIVIRFLVCFPPVGQWKWSCNTGRVAWLEEKKKHENNNNNNIIPCRRWTGKRTGATNGRE